MKYIAHVEDETFTIEIAQDGQVLVDGRPVSVDLQSVDDPFLYSLILDNVSYEAYVEAQEEGRQVLLRGQEFLVNVREAWTHGLEPGREGWGPPTAEMVIRAPLPGMVLASPVTAGQEVSAGDLLVVLETMKMENDLRAPRAGTVQKVHVAPGEAVAADQPLVLLRTEGPAGEHEERDDG